MDAEAWAIWQALEITLEKAHTDRACVKPRDPCSVVVIYSNCITVLRRIGNHMPGGGVVVQNIITQSIKLKRLGVEVQLHWVPGHRNIPGNELADLVAKKARQPMKQDLERSLRSQCVFSPSLLHTISSGANGGTNNEMQHCQLMTS